MCRQSPGCSVRLVRRAILLWNTRQSKRTTSQSLAVEEPPHSLLQVLYSALHQSAANCQSMRAARGQQGGLGIHTAN